MTFHQQRLISHSISPENLQITVEKFKQKHAANPNNLKIIQELAQFSFGQYLLQHQGINGFWTHYMLTYPWFNKNRARNTNKQQETELEYFLLNKAPTLLATQQRFEIFLRENQQSVKEHATLACIPCGMMGELLYLDFNHINHIKLVGVDYDPHTLKDAASLAKQHNLLNFVSLENQDAFELDYQQAFDLISSNGLNIYEIDDTKVTTLYKNFYRALKPGGKFVTSFLTPPPHLTDHCEWDFTKINMADLALQKSIFVDIIEAKWQAFRSSDQTEKQLITAGFCNIQLIYDDAKMFPTAVAYKE